MNQKLILRVAHRLHLGTRAYGALGQPYLKHQMFGTNSISFGSFSTEKGKPDDPEEDKNDKNNKKDWKESYQ